MTAPEVGRCHGPGCTREATATEFFCGEKCAIKWDRQWFTEHGGDLVLDKAWRPTPAVVEALSAEAGWASFGWIVGNPFEFVDEDRERLMRPYPLADLPAVSVEIELTPEGARYFSEMFHGSSAEFQQVASKDPQVGWLGRVLHRLFGRTT